MPTYVYACKNCEHRFEQYQSFSEDSLTTCPECQQSTLRKVFDTVGIVFKGSGFYSTDSQSSASGSTAAKSPSSGGSEGSGSGASGSDGSGTPSSTGSSTSASSSGSSTSTTGASGSAA